MSMKHRQIWQTIVAVIAVVVFTCIFRVVSATPIEKPCSKLDERAAEDVAGKLMTWAAAHDAYLNFSHCDDGNIGEGFSDSITTLLASKWSQFEELNRLTRSDKGFEKFVLRHVDATVPLERLDIVRQNALRRCPSGTQLCQKIAKSAANARERLQNPQSI